MYLYLYNEPTVWVSSVNASEKKELAWYRLSSTFNTHAITQLITAMFVIHELCVLSLDAINGLTFDNKLLKEVWIHSNIVSKFSCV